LVRDISRRTRAFVWERKIFGQPALQHACEPRLERVKQFRAQRPDDNNKIYVLHAPEVECIAKGNARTRYEFGVKMSIAVTNREPTAVSSSGASAPLPDCLMTAIR